MGASFFMISGITLTFPVILDFFSDNLDITFCLRNIIVYGVYVSLGDFHFAALRSQKALSDVLTESIFIKYYIDAQIIGAWLSVINHIAAAETFSHVFFVAPGRDGNLS